jgi:hypothetical protein
VTPGRVMIVHGDPLVDACAGVIQHLAAQYDGAVPRPVVVAVVTAAGRDLSGQTAPGSFDEMLHRLASYRLQQLAGDQTCGVC